MSLRILGGMAKGHELITPRGDLIRPTSVMLKRRLFDSHQNWQGKTFIDLCAGSGAMGLEAWSRGAQKVVLIENSAKVFTSLKKNVAKIKESFEQEYLQRSIQINQASCSKWLKIFKEEYLSLTQEQQENTLLFLDPPYREINLYEAVVDDLVDWFKGVLWIESDEQKGLPQKFWSQQKGLESTKSFTQGASYISIFDFS